MVLTCREAPGESPLSSGEGEAESMVRIVIHGTRNKGAIASLLVAVVAAASVWAGYWVWHHDDRVVPQKRSIEDVIVRWRCPNGHVFEAKGSYGAIPCPTCNQPARVLITYRCPKHSTVDLLVMFDETTGKPTHVQFEGGKWIPVSTIIPCPHCGREMHPKRYSPFEKTDTAAQRKAGGPPANPPS